MLWSRKPAAVHDRARAVGLDVTASRVRAEAVGGKPRALVLDDPDAELLLVIAGDRRTPEVGRTAFALCRKLPHVICSNFLASLGGQLFQRLVLLARRLPLRGRELRPGMHLRLHALLFGRA